MIKWHDSEEERIHYCLCAAYAGLVKNNILQTKIAIRLALDGGSVLSPSDCEMVKARIERKQG